MEQAYLYKSEAAMALTTTIARTWAYPLQATIFTFKQCIDIMKPAYGKILAKMGLNRHLPLVYRYAPKELNGMGLPHVHTLQGIAQMKAFVSHMKSNTKLGALIEAEMETANLEMGTGTHIFDLEFNQ